MTHYKKAQADLNISTERTLPIDLKATFSTQDINSALLIFTLKKDGENYPLSDDMTAVLYLIGNQLHVKKEMEINSLNSEVYYLLTPEEIKHAGKVDGELYIYLNNEESQSLSAHKFKFNIERALMDQDIEVSENVYIEDFESVKKEYELLFANLKTELEAKISDLHTSSEQLQADAQVLKQQFDALNPEQFARKDGGVFTKSLTLNNYDVYTKEKPVQEYVLTDSGGKLLLKSSIDFNNLDAYLTTSYSGYVTTSTNVPFGLNGNGYFELKMRSSGYGVATYQPHNSNIILMNRREGDTKGWQGWEKTPIDTAQVQPIVDKALDDAKAYTDSRLVPSTIWSGALTMQAADTITLSLPLSKCTAWVIYWSGSVNGTAVNENWTTQTVTRETFGGHNHTTMVEGENVQKIITISDTTITGADANNSGANGLVFLRKVVALR
ncbi:BppU family phage baseplate upper protein [Listeria fleischmannii]|uniref:BppU N-terminal domain-containing protein n=1 Tax=Listeria fleischmannii FSL S10-1203 TaxID=1265822 RepID=W7DNN9_9LIST|nr:BppU family phage baseplate upper protein [Listeria fleischmannii]EUJ59565.1 hypothetical protein MCOL2_05675 [Listeria fleischmannii FSL S10-1203]